MRKPFLIVTLLLSMSLLATACTGQTTSGSSQNSSADVSGSVQESSDSSPAAPSQAGEATFLVGLDKRPVYTGEITTLLDKAGRPLPAEELTKENFKSAVCEGFCYLAQPSGIALTSVDQPDQYDGEGDFFKVDSDMTIDPVFQRYNIGDSFGDLTVTKASVTFDSEDYDWDEYYMGNGDVKKGSELDFPEIFYRTQSVELEGEVTLTGYLSVHGEDDYNPQLTGNLELVIDSQSADLLPVAVADRVLELGYVFTYQPSDSIGSRVGDYMRWQNDYGLIYLGNINDVPVDTTGINTSRDFYTKVKVTCNRIVMYSYSYSYAVQGDMVKLEIVE